MNDAVFRLIYRSHSRIVDGDAQAELGRILRSPRTKAMAHVGDHGSPDMPMTATTSGVTEAAAWTPSAAQEDVLGACAT